MWVLRWDSAKENEGSTVTAKECAYTIVEVSYERKSSKLTFSNKD